MFVPNLFPKIDVGADPGVCPYNGKRRAHTRVRPYVLFEEGLKNHVKVSCLLFSSNEVNLVLEESIPFLLQDLLAESVISYFSNNI